MVQRLKFKIFLCFQFFMISAHLLVFSLCPMPYDPTLPEIDFLVGFNAAMLFGKRLMISRHCDRTILYGISQHHKLQFLDIEQKTHLLAFMFFWNTVEVKNWSINLDALKMRIWLNWIGAIFWHHLCDLILFSLQESI